MKERYRVLKKEVNSAVYDDTDGPREHHAKWNKADTRKQILQNPADKSCPTLCDPRLACQASLSFTISWSWLKLVSTDSLMPSNHLTVCHPLLLLPSIFPSIRVFSRDLALPCRISKNELRKADRRMVVSRGWKVFPGGSVSKDSVCNVGDPSSIPGSRRSPGEGNGDPLQYSCLENPMDRGAWQARVHGVATSQTRLGN